MNFVSIVAPMIYLLSIMNFEWTVYFEILSVQCYSMLYKILYVKKKKIH